MTMQGTIKKVLRDFGFITPDGGGADVFFHRSRLQPETFGRLSPGQRVAFEVMTDNRGRAAAVKVAVEAAQPADKPMSSVPSVAAPASSLQRLESEQMGPTTELANRPSLRESENVTELGSDEVDESAQTGRSKRGKVKNFDAEKGWGFITPDERGRDLFVRHANLRGLAGFKSLFPGEAVLFDVEDGDRGPCAVNVRLAAVPVLNGKVQSFDEDEERGLILPNGGTDPVVFHRSGIADKITDDDLSNYENGELVKYRVVESPNGPIAVRVTLLDRRRPLERFADLSSLDRLLPRLAEKAAPEEWNFRIRPLEFPYPILENYLFYTFKRIKQEEKLFFGKDHRGKPVACFNTGLATSKQDEIYAFFTEVRRKTQIRTPQTILETKWQLTGFFGEAEGPMVDIPTMPELASYFEGDSFKNLVFDHDLSFRVRRPHCLDERRGRYLSIPDLPEALRDDREGLGDKFDLAVKMARRRVRRNYKTAIPTFNRGKISLLLPLCIVKKDRADLALLVVRHSNYDKTTDYYIGWTVLTLDQAYSNARLLARPDTEWLTP